MKAACEDAWVGPVFGDDAAAQTGRIEVLLPRVPGGCELRVRSFLSRICSPTQAGHGAASSGTVAEGCTAESQGICGATQHPGTIEIRAGGKVLGKCGEPPQCSTADEEAGGAAWRWRGKGRGSGVVCEVSLGVFNDPASPEAPHASVGPTATEEPAGAPGGRHGLGETRIAEVDVAVVRVRVGGEGEAGGGEEVLARQWLVVTSAAQVVSPATLNRFNVFLAVRLPDLVINQFKP